MDYRDRMGRFTKGHKFITTAALVIGFFFVLAFIADLLGLTENDVHAQNFIVQTAFADITLEAKLEAKKEAVLDRLAKCESGGKKEEDGITTLDSNDVGSYGAFQWQRKSVIHYYKQMTGNEINGRDAIILAMTPDKARDLARYVIFETENGAAKDWVNCSARLNLQAEVDWIKSLEN